MPSVEGFKKGWYRVPKAIRKPLVFIVGFAVVAAGVLMLVLPGPGWVAIFLGFAILATEFAFAEKVRDWLVQFLKNIIAWLKMHWNRHFRKKSAKNTPKPKK
jgi:uncharacterized protein (TIGR02611 family)